MFSPFIEIASTQRSSGESHDFRISLPRHFDEGEHKLCMVNIPNSFFSIEDYVNNQFTMNGVLITIPPGYVSTGELAGILHSAIEDFLPGLINIIEIDSTRNRLNIVGNAELTLDPGIASEVLGIPETVTDFTIISSYPPNLSRTISYHILIEGSTSIEDVKQQHSSFIVPVTEGSQSWITYEPRQSFPQHVILNHRFKTIRVQVLDDQYRPLNLQGFNWSMILAR